MTTIEPPAAASSRRVQSWLNLPEDSPLYTLSSIPIGIVSTPTYPDRRPAVRIGDRVLNLAVFAKWGGFSRLPCIQPYLAVFERETLDAYAEVPDHVRGQVREYLKEVLTDDGRFANVLQRHPPLRAACVFWLEDVRVHVPFEN